MVYFYGMPRNVRRRVPTTYNNAINNNNQNVTRSKRVLDSKFDNWVYKKRRYIPDIETIFIINEKKSSYQLPKLKLPPSTKVSDIIKQLRAKGVSTCPELFRGFELGLSCANLKRRLAANRFRVYTITPDKMNYRLSSLIPGQNEVECKLVVYVSSPGHRHTTARNVFYI